MDAGARNFLMIVLILIAIAVAGLVWYNTSGNGAATSTPPIATTTPPGSTTTPPIIPPPIATTTSATSSVKIALLDTAGSSNGKPRACDKVVLINRTVATTTMPLTAALRNLFAISTTSVSGWFNFIDRTNETLKFDRATVVSGTANIYLTGSLSGLAGVCDDPRAAIQIEETALQFPTVQRVQLYLNNATTTLIPSQQ